LYLVWLGEKLLELKATDDAISVWKSACDVNNSFKTAAIRARLYYYLSQLTGPGQKGYDSDVYIETLGRALDLFRSIERSTPTSSLMPFYCMVKEFVVFVCVFFFKKKSDVRSTCSMPLARSRKSLRVT